MLGLGLSLSRGFVSCLDKCLVARVLLGLGLSLSRSLVSGFLISLVACLLVGLSLLRGLVFRILLGLEAGVAHRLEPDVRHGLSSSLDLDLVFRFVLGVFGFGCQSVLTG